MIFGAAPTDSTPTLPPSVPHDMALAHLLCMAKRQECLIQRNRGLGLVGTVFAVGLAMWIFSPKCTK
jgi:hypothetical protein